MFSGILLPGTTELYTVFKKGSSWKCTFTRQKMFSRRAWSIYVTPLDLFSLLLLNFLLANLMHMWMERIPMIRFLLVLPHYRYTGNSTSSFNNVSNTLPKHCWSLMAELNCGRHLAPLFWICGLRIHLQFWLPQELVHHTVSPLCHINKNAADVCSRWNFLKQKLQVGP